MIEKKRTYEGIRYRCKKCRQWFPSEETIRTSNECFCIKCHPPMERTYNKDIKDSACKTIYKHEKEMKDDPESLSTEFIEDVVGVHCKKLEEEKKVKYRYLGPSAYGETCEIIKEIDDDTVIVKFESDTIYGEFSVPKKYLEEAL